MQTQRQEQPPHIRERLLSSRKPEIRCCLHENPQVHLTMALVYRHQAVCFPPFPIVMQQLLLKNLLSEPKAAFWCVSVHRLLWVYFQIYREQILASSARLLPQSWRVVGLSGGGGAINLFLVLAFKGVHKCNSRTRLGCENVGFQLCSLLKILCMAPSSTLSLIERNSVHTYNGS